MPKIISLLKTTFVDAWRLKKSLVPIILVIIVPVVLLGLLTNNDQTLGSYGSFATLIMNVAVIYAVVTLKAGAKKVPLSEAYYAGTARFVAFICIIGLLAVQMIPFIIGGLIYLSGSTGATVGLGPVEMSLLGGVWLLFAIPSFRWLTRTVFALYLVLDPAISPVTAARTSSRLVRGRGWTTFARIAVGSIVMLALLIVPSLAISMLPETASWLAKAGTGILQLLSAIVLVPFAAVYGYNILEGLGAKPKAS